MECLHRLSCTASLFPCSLRPFSLAANLYGYYIRLFEWAIHILYSGLTFVTPRVTSHGGALPMRWATIRIVYRLVFTALSKLFVESAMGVPAFFRWLSRKYSAIVVHCVEEKVAIDRTICSQFDLPTHVHVCKFTSLYFRLGRLTG